MRILTLLAALYPLGTAVAGPVKAPARAPATLHAAVVDSQDLNGAQARLGAAEEAAGLRTAVEQAFVVVHLEPGPDARSLEHPEAHWDELEAVVALADAHGASFTLAFSPQWALYAATDPLRLEQVQGWQSVGHEVALHHHGLSHPEWDGYSNHDRAMHDEPYMGNSEDLLAAVETLGEVRTAAAFEPELDWPIGLRVDTLGEGDLSSLLSRPARSSHRGQEVVQIINAPVEGDRAVEPAEVVEALDQADPAEVLGLVFHASELASVEARLGDILNLLATREVEVRGAATGVEASGAP